MDKSEFLREIEKIMEAPPRSLTGDELLAGFANWDSLAQLEVMALLDRCGGKIANPREIDGNKSIDQLFAYIDNA